MYTDIMMKLTDEYCPFDDILSYLGNWSIDNKIQLINYLKSTKLYKEISLFSDRVKKIEKLVIL